MKRFPTFLLLALNVIVCGFALGCQPAEVTARDGIAAFRGYLISAQSRHVMECIAANGKLPVCDTLRRADASLNVAKDALEIYCGWAPGTDPAAPCSENKSAQAALTVALANMQKISGDIKAAAQ
jgi:hypothetical protein